MAKKIGGTERAVKSTEKKERKGKAQFDLKTATDENGKAIPGRTDGKLEAVPANYDFDSFKPLKKTDFKTEAVYLDYQSAGHRHRAQAFLDRAEKAEKRAERLRQFGDEATRKKANKLMKAREQLAKLEAELGEAGLDLSLLEN